MLTKMFGHTLIAELFEKAGWVAIPLGICSVLALAVLLERLFTYNKLMREEDTAFQILFTAMQNGDMNRISDPALAYAPVTHVMNTLVAMRGASAEAHQQVADIAVSVQRLRLRRYLTALATIGSTSPFIGLFGTVLGVQAAFQTLSSSGAGADKMSVGISEALSATALGLLVAIPAVIAYNYLLGQVQGQLLRIQGHVAQLMPFLNTAAVRERERV